MLAVVMLFAPAAEAAGTTITVTTTADSSTASACATSCPTLRDAAAEANSLTTSPGSPVTIVLPAGITNVSEGPITLGSATNLDFTLTGPDSNAADAVIQATGSTLGQGTLIVAPDANIDSTFANLTVTGGNANASSFGGGALLTGYTNQTTTVSNCVFSANVSAAPAGGGAIANEGGPAGGASLTVTNSTFTGNSTSLGPGGAVLSENNAGTTGNVVLAGDSFSDNTARSPSANGSAFGGAVQVLSASLNVSGTVFEANVAQISGSGTPAEPPAGGALYVDSASSAAITTSTFLNNSTSAGGEGGAVYNNDDTLTLSDSRLVGNTSNGGHGDAVVNETNGGTVTATSNWWGQNSGPTDNEVNGNGGAVPSTAPYLELAITASPSTVAVGDTSTITAGLLKLSDGTAVPSGALDGLGSFTGILNGQSAAYVDGRASTTFTGTAAGTFPVSASVDNQTVSTNVTVQSQSLQIVVSGDQTFGSSSPSFVARPRSGSLPSGVSLSGSPVCTTVNSGTPIDASLPAGDYALDSTSCFGLSLSGPNAGNYTMDLIGSSFLVNQATLLVNVAGSQTFGSSSPSFTASPEDGALPSGVSFGGTLSCTEVNSGTIDGSLPAGTYTIDGGSCSGLSLSGPNAGDYTPILLGGPFVVSPEALAVSVSGSQTFGSHSPIFTAQSGSGSLPSGVSLGGSPVCTTVNSGTAIDASLPVGSYTIDGSSCSGVSLTGSNAGDYTPTISGGSFLVHVAAQAITFTPLSSPTTAGTSATLSATGGGSPEPVTFSVDAAGTSPSDACTVSQSGPGQGTVSYRRVGTCELEASQAASADGNYAAAAPVYQTITIQPVASAVTLTAPPAIVFGQSATATAIVSERDHSSPAGSVQFTLDGADLGSPVRVSDGKATSPDAARSLPPGAHQIGATFTPQANSVYAAGSAPAVTEVVEQAATRTTVAVHPGSITATVVAVAPGAGTPTGTIAFSVDGSAVGTAVLSGGAATLTHQVRPGATRAVAAAYAGDADFTGSSASTSRSDPTITAHLSSAHPVTRYGWYRGPVTVRFTCSSHGAALTAACPRPVTLTRTGAGQSVTRTITATDGGAATVVERGIDIDRTTPGVRVLGIRNGRDYDGSAPRERCTGSDNPSGIASCRLQAHRGRSRRGLEITTVRYTATATDRAGNTRRISGRYRILGIYLQGVAYRHGRFQVRLGRTYTIVVTRTSQTPRYWDASPGTQRPTGADNAFHRAGTRTWAEGVALPVTMRRHSNWNLGVRIGDVLHVLPIHAL